MNLKFWHSDGDDDKINHKHRPVDRILESDSNADYATEQRPGSPLLPQAFEYWQYPALIETGESGSDRDDCKNIARELGVITEINHGTQE